MVCKNGRSKLCNGAKATQSTHIVTGSLLAIHLKRFSFDNDTDEVIKDPRDVAFDLAMQVSGQTFDLCGLVEHLSAAAGTGHYVAYVRRESQWFRMDDATVGPVDSPRPECQAYIAFYTRRSAADQLLSPDAHQVDTVRGAEAVTTNSVPSKKKTTKKVKKLPTAVTDPLRVGDRLGIPPLFDDYTKDYRWGTVTAIDIDQGVIVVDASSDFVETANLRLQEAATSKKDKRSCNQAQGRISSFFHERLNEWIHLHVDYGIHVITGHGEVGLSDKAIHALQKFLQSMGKFAHKFPIAATLDDDIDDQDGYSVIRTHEPLCRRIPHVILFSCCESNQ